MTTSDHDKLIELLAAGKDVDLLATLDKMILKSLLRRKQNETNN